MIVFLYGAVDIIAAALLAMNADYIGLGIFLWVIVAILLFKGLFSFLGIFGS